MRQLVSILTAGSLAACGAGATSNEGHVSQALEPDPVNLFAYHAVPRFVLVGTDVEMGFGFFNTGTGVAATYVEARIEIRGAFAAIGDVADPVEGCTFSESPGVAIYSCSWLELFPEEGRWTRIFVRPEAVGPIEVTSEIHSAEPELDPGDNAPHTTVQVFDTPVADLNLVRGKQPRPRPGGTFGEIAVGLEASARFFLFNNGPSDSTGAVVDMELSGPARFTSPQSAECTVANDTHATCTFGAQAVNETAFPAVGVVATAPGDVVVRATATGQVRDPELANNRAEIRWVAYVPKYADVAVSAVAAPGRTYRDPIRYTITARNLGPDAATAVFLEHYEDASMKITSLTTAQGTCDMADNAFWCQLGEIPAGGSAALVVVVQPSLGGTFGTYTGAFDQGPRTIDPNRENNSATTEVTLRGPNPPVTARTTSERVPVDFWFWLDCANEPVIASGMAHQVVTSITNSARSSGSWRLEMNLSDVTGTAADSGAAYRAASASTTRVSWEGTGASSYRATAHLDVVGQGAAPDATVHVMFRYDYDMSGNVTRTMERVWATCR